MTEKSGQELAYAFEQLATHGVYSPSESRPEILDQLRESGVDVEHDHARLPATTELLARETILAELNEATRSWLRELRIFSSIDSTNTALCDRAKEESIDGLVFLAETQTGGRGRRGRDWVSPFAQNIAISIGLRLDLSAVVIQPLSLVVGQVVLETLRTLGVENLNLKWPNDILLNGAKLGGILIELTSATRPVELVIGIGINVGGYANISSRVDNEVAELRSQLEGPIRNRLIALLLNKLRSGSLEFVANGFSSFRRRWEENDFYRGKPVVISTPNESIEGMAEGLGMDGALLLRTDSGLRSIVAGEVSLRPQ